MTTTETRRINAIARRVPDIKGWVDKRLKIDPSWGNISRPDVARIKSGRMGTDALRLWASVNGSRRIGPNDEFLETAIKLCPAAGESMRKILVNQFQEYPANTTTALAIEGSESGKIIATVLKIERERKMGDDGQFHLVEKNSALFSSHPCQEISPRSSRRERLANKVKNVVWSRR
jgi:hypothetical protein